MAAAVLTTSSQQCSWPKNTDDCGVARAAWQNATDPHDGLWRTQLTGSNECEHRPRRQVVLVAVVRCRYLWALTTADGTTFLLRFLLAVSTSATLNTLDKHLRLFTHTAPHSTGAGAFHVTYYAWQDILPVAPRAASCQLLNA